MTNTSLEILDGFGLFAKTVLGRIKNWTDADFGGFFSEYVTAARSRKLVEVAQRGSTDVFPDSVSRDLPVSVIRQLCVYANRIYIHDPVIDLAEKFSALDTHFERIVRTPNRDDRIAEFRIEFAEAIEQFLELRPLIDLGVIHVTATQLLIPKREPGGVYASDLYGPTGQFSGGEITAPVLQLPPSLADYVNENICISPAQIKDGKVVIYREQQLAPTRTIAVRFADGIAPMIFCLSSLSLKNKQDQEGQIGLSLEYQLDGGAGDLDSGTFHNWVIGESQKYVRNRLNELNTNLVLAAMARATFLTNIPSSKDLVSIDLNAVNTPDHTLASLLEVDLPYLSNVQIAELAKARKDESAFEDFRIALNRAFSELENIENGDRQRRIDELVRDLVQSPLAKIDKRLRSLHRDVFVDSVLAVGTFASTILSGGSTLIGLAAVAAAAKAADSYKKVKVEEDKLREHSSFFFWEATKGARKRK